MVIFLIIVTLFIFSLKPLKSLLHFYKQVLKLPTVTPYVPIIGNVLQVLVPRNGKYYFVFIKQCIFVMHS